MVDLTRPMALSKEIQSGVSPRRVTAVDNIVVACQNLIKQRDKVSAATVERTIKSLERKGPAAQSIYNSPELSALVKAFSDAGNAQVEVGRKVRACSSDEEQLLDALVSPRLKSMLRDVIGSRDRSQAECQLLDNYVRKLKASEAKMDFDGSNTVKATESLSAEEKLVVEQFFKMLDGYGYGFDFVDDELVKSGKTTNSGEFIALLRRRGLL